MCLEIVPACPGQLSSSCITKVCLYTQHKVKHLPNQCCPSSPILFVIVRDRKGEFPVWELHLCLCLNLSSWGSDAMILWIASSGFGGGWCPLPQEKEFLLVLTGRWSMSWAGSLVQSQMKYFDVPVHLYFNPPQALESDWKNKIQVAEMSLVVIGCGDASPLCGKEPAEVVLAPD